MPTRLIVGGEDGKFRDIAAGMTQISSFFQVSEITGVGHNPILESAPAVRRIIDQDDQRSPGELRSRALMNLDLYVLGSWPAAPQHWRGSSTGIGGDRRERPRGHDRPLPPSRPSWGRVFSRRNSLELRQ